MSIKDKLAAMKKHKKRRKAAGGSFEELLVGDTVVDVFNVYIHTDKTDRKQYIELAASDTVEALHYSNVDITLKTKEKALKINADFVDAVQRKRFKVYTFEIKSMSEYYI